MFTHLEELHSNHIQRFDEKIQQNGETDEIICLICDKRVETKTEAYKHINEDHPSHLSNLKKEIMEAKNDETENISTDPLKLSEGQEMAIEILNTINLNELENTIMNEKEIVPEYAEKENSDDLQKEEIMTEPTEAIFITKTELQEIPKTCKYELDTDSVYD